MLSTVTVLLLFVVATGLSAPDKGCSFRRTTTTILPTDDAVVARRRVAAGLLAAACAVVVHPACAFDNGIPEMARYATSPKYPGTPPTNLGRRADTGRLATCDYAPNCFSTSGDASHRLELWRAPHPRTAGAELLRTLRAYPPGQARVDKGGFRIVVAEPHYVYVQYESLKLGFVDDVEFALDDDDATGILQVRSSSRLGFLDLGVNGKRLNWIAATLRDDHGWTAPAITQDTHPDYFPMLPFSFDDYVRSVVSPTECPTPSNPLQCGGISLRPPGE